MAAPSSTIDIESDAFALRLANLLRSTRLEQGRSLRALARASGGRYTRDHLRGFEAGGTGVGVDVVENLSELYGADLGAILPSRLPVVIARGVISAGGVTATFVATNGTSLLTAYLRLIRTMRRQQKVPLIVLRREDIEVIAEYLDEPGEAIVDRLTALMGATLTQRTAVATMFATGAIVIGLAGSTAARPPEAGSNVGLRSDHTVEVVTDPLATLDAVVIAGDVDDAPASTTGLAEAVRSTNHDVESPEAIAATADPTPAKVIDDSPPVSDASTSSIELVVPGADVVIAVASSTDEPPVPAATAVTTPADSGGMVIPDLPYGDAIVIDDGSGSSTSPSGSGEPAADSSTDAPPTVANTPAAPPVVATDGPPVPVAG